MKTLLGFASSLLIAGATHVAFAQTPPPAQPAPAQPAPAQTPPPAQPAPAQPAPAQPAPAQPPPAQPAPAQPAPVPQAEPAPTAEPAPAAAPAPTPAAEPAPAPPPEAQPAPTAEPAPAAAESSVPLTDEGETTQGSAKAPVAPKQHGRDAKFILGVLYDTALPLGNTADFNKKFSGRGFSIEARYRGFKMLRFGGEFSFQDFLEKQDSTYRYENATIGGVQVRETSVTNITANAALAWDKSKGPVIPYVRLGIGPSRVWRRVDIGISRFIAETWHFALVPEVGVEIPLQRMIVLVAARYNQIFKGDGGPSQSYLNFSAGLGFE